VYDLQCAAFGCVDLAPSKLYIWGQFYELVSAVIFRLNSFKSVFKNRSHSYDF
jgi:hypothetical protein